MAMHFSQVPSSVVCTQTIFSSRGSQLTKTFIMHTFFPIFGRSGENRTPRILVLETSALPLGNAPMYQLRPMRLERMAFGFGDRRSDPSELRAQNSDPLKNFYE
jgi:hypothetical protein